MGSLKRQLYTLSYDAIHTNIIHKAIEHFIQIGKVILFFWHSSSPKFTALLYPYTRKIGIDLKSGFTQQKNRSILPLNYKINYWNETQFFFFWKKTKKAVNIILVLKNESSSIMLKAGWGVLFKLWGNNMGCLLHTQMYTHNANTNIHVHAYICVY